MRSDPQIQAKFVELQNTMSELTTSILKLSPNGGKWVVQWDFQGFCPTKK